MFFWAERHKDYGKELLKVVEKQQLAMVTAKATREARQLYNWNRQVAMSYHKTLSFLRLKTSKKGILYAEIEPEHFVEDFIVRHFMNRFPTYIILIGSKRGTFIAVKKWYRGKSSKPLKEVLEGFEKNMKEDDILSEIDNFDEKIWDVYYGSQDIEERYNKKLFLHMMPKKYHYLTNYESMVLNKNKRLDEF